MLCYLLRKNVAGNIEYIVDRLMNKCILRFDRISECCLNELTQLINVGMRFLHQQWHVFGYHPYISIENENNQRKYP